MMVANLIFAGLLPPEDYGKIAFFQGIVAVGGALGPLGIDQLAARGQMPRSWFALFQAAPVLVIIAVIVAVLGVVAYGLAAPVVILASLGATGAGMASTLAAFNQATVRFGRAQLILQSPFVVVGISSLVLLWAGVHSWIFAAGLITLGYAVATGLGLAMFRPLVDGRGERLGRDHVRAAVPLGAISVSVLLLSQLDRIIIPQTLGFSELASYSVIAVIVASPLRLLAGGITYSLIPRLRRSTSAEERRKLVRHELALGLGLSAIGSLILIFGTAPLIRLLYGAKYSAPTGLVLVILALGWSRLLHGVAAGVALGVFSQKRLQRFNLLGWGAVIVTAVLAVVMSRCSLPGIVLALTLGWLGRAAAAHFVFYRSQEA